MATVLTVTMDRLGMIGQLPDEILEKIFTYLDFQSLISSEMTCWRWRSLINDRRLFWQLSKNIAKSELGRGQKRLPPPAENDVLAAAARDVRRQANKYKLGKLI